MVWHRIFSMASSLVFCNTAISSSTATFRRRLPLLGAFCVFTIGFSKLSPFFSSTYKSNLPYSWFGSQSQVRSSYSISSMASSSTTVSSIVVYVTVPNADLGKKLAQSIVREKLGACVSRIPGIESVYEWQGKVQTDSEELLIIKTRESLLENLTEHIKANHEYDVPEVIALPISGGNLQYLEWLKKSTRG